MHVLVVGSSVIDLFLNLDSDHYKIQDKKILLDLGDKIPSEIKKTALGGNGANTSVGLTRLEIPTTFYTYLGDDFFSREIQEGLTREGVDLDVERHDETSSVVHIILDFPQDRVILSNYSKSKHNFAPSKGAFDWLFLTSIPDFWEDAYQKTLEFTKEHNIPLAFSPGTRQVEDKNDLVVDIIKNSKLYFSNKEEAEMILGKPAGTEIKELLTAIADLGPEIASVTDGPNGAYAVDKNNNCYFIEPTPTQGHEKTGAGDAYASGFFASTLSGNDVPTSMVWGCLNSGGVMQHVGAQTGILTSKKLDEQIKEHNNLKAKPI